MLFSKKIIGSLNRPKTSAAEAEGRLLKSFGIGRLCSASVIVWCKYVSHLKQNSRKTLENDTKVLFTFQKKSQLMINNEYVIGIKFLNKSKSNQVR